MAATLAEEFNVSEDAIRRDLRALAAEGKCRRVYGGALPVSSRWRTTPAANADSANRRRALAKGAAALVVQGEFLFLTVGNINAALVEFLPRDSSLSIATNSIDVAARVMDRGDLPLIIVGGSVSADSNGCIDASAVEAVSRMNIDRCFLGEGAISLEDGMSVGDYADATFRRALLLQSKVCVIAAMDEMFSAQEPHRIATFQDIDCIVVEDSIDDRHFDGLLSHGVTVKKCDTARA